MLVAGVGSLTVALAVAGVLSGAAVVGQDGTPIVVAQDGSGDATTIGEALAVAGDGDTILVRPGTYEEAITIEADVTVSGDGPRDQTVIAFSDGETPLVTMRDSDALLSGLTLRGDQSFVLVIGGAPTLQDLVFDGVGSGFGGDETCHALFGPGSCNPVAVRFEGTQAQLLGSTFIDSAQVGVHGGASPLIEGNELSGGSFIFLEDFGDETVVRGNTIRDAGHAAIAIYTTGRPLIEGNIISGAGGSAIEVGLDLAPGIAPLIRGNTITESETGIQVAAGAEPVIEDNELVANGSAIVIAGADAVISGNRILDNASGVFVLQGTPTLEGNTISGGRVGLGLGSDRATPILVGNTICENETNLNLIFGAEMPTTEGNEICP
jgi:parallel beta-helix repeat protein